MRAYRLLTGDDSPEFCHKVTRALARGWQLHGDPQFSYDAGRGVMCCAQAVVKDVDADYDPAMKLGDL